MHGALRWTGWALGVCIAAWSGMAVALGTSSEHVIRHLQPLIDAGVAPGAAVATIQDGKAALHYLGARSAEDPRAPDADTLFEIGSVTKTLTATLLALLVAEGRVALDTPVADLLPPPAAPRRAAGGRAITLEDLATHRSGLPRLPDNLAPTDWNDPYAEYKATDLYAFLRDHAPDRPPGGPYLYSNLGYALLGHALAQAGEAPFAAQIARRITTPLGMRDTHAAPPGNAEERVAPPHRPATTPGAPPVPGHRWRFDVFAPAGGMWSTIADMATYLRANLHPDGGPLAPVAALLHSPRGDVSEGMAIALGWHVRAQSGGTPAIVWHNGETGGYCAFLGFVPETGVGVAILTNSAAAARVDEAALRILVELEPWSEEALATGCVELR